MIEHRGSGSWLVERCQKEGLSLRQAAAKTGLSHATIDDIRKGGGASAETIRKLAQAFGGDGREMLALEDKLLVLSGYRSERPEGEDLSEPMARLLDRLSGFSEPQLKLMERFAEFIAGIPVKGGRKRGTGHKDARSFLKQERG
ncbi:hypothetical protein ES703_78525 [subsurface metagenome]